MNYFTDEALNVKEPVTEPVRDVELHGMLGKKPLHVSSDFLGETLSAISIKPDGLKRYSYKSLINPDLTCVSILTVSTVTNSLSSHSSHFLFLRFLHIFNFNYMLFI